MAEMDEVLAISKSTDRLALLKAKEAAKKKMATNPKPGDLEVFKKTQAALENYDDQKPSKPGLVFHTQAEAVEYLNDYGYKIKKSKFSKDFREGHVSVNAEGLFEKSALLGYAAIHCQAVERLEDRAGSEANLERIRADAENKRAMAERNRLKLERELGSLISRDEHETELAARAAFFRREIETFGRRLAPRIIALVAGDDQQLEALKTFWREETEIWMDAWAQDRPFIIPQGAADDAPPDMADQSEDLDQQDEDEDELIV